MGTMFLIAALSFTVSIILKLLGAVVASYVVKYLARLAASTSPKGVSNMVMRLGGLGLLMTLFLITVPPIAAVFFQGAVGQFKTYNSFWQGQVAQQNPGQAGVLYPSAPAVAPNAGMTAPAPQTPQRTYG